MIVDIRMRYGGITVPMLHFFRSHILTLKEMIKIQQKTRQIFFFYFGVCITCNKI